ncbi:MAG: hypothetical protein R3E86_12310 [Pseudomonadales bacterium]
MMASDSDQRRNGGDRRGAEDRRRSARGLFELRARREGIAGDRRRSERRDAPGGRSWFGFWRRSD